MACFLVPAGEAVVTTIVTKAVEAKEKSSPAQQSTPTPPSTTIPLSQKLHWLNYLLIGGAILLAFEHVWHGEVVPWFPFLTAAANPADASAMLHEMATAGVLMAVLVTVVWGVMCVVADRIVRRDAGQPVAQAGAAA